jgi:hypothetical protein
VDGGVTRTVLEGAFTVFTTDQDLIRVPGWGTMSRFGDMDGLPAERSAQDAILSGLTPSQAEAGAVADPHGPHGSHA